MPLQATESHSKPRKPTNPTPDTNSNFQGPYKPLQSPTELSEGYVRVLDKGFVLLTDRMGNDLTVVNKARVSFNLFKTKLDKKDEKLIHFLMKNKHATPFEGPVFEFRIRAPLFVIMEWIRHRGYPTEDGLATGISYNGQSLRYSLVEPEFYNPEYIRTQVGKPGAYTFKQMNEKDSLTFRRWVEDYCEYGAKLYQRSLDLGVAKELASRLLPPFLYVSYVWTVNVRSLMNWISLRNTEDALFEIREYAIVIEDFFKQEMPITHKAFIECGRRAP